MPFWSADDTFVAPPSFTTTAGADETVAIDVTPRLVGGDPPTDPLATLYRIVDNGADVAADLADSPAVDGNTITQRLRDLEAGTVYRLRLTFLTGGNRRPATLAVICVE